ncbi:sugar transferase [Limosilactobacillus pulli]|uniref:sugar transferase n=1 Tax=Limosilactobacillus pulli TaxID=2991833 RepID=UPI0038CBF6E5
MATKTKPYVNQQRVKKQLFYPVFKRNFDMIASLLALLLLSPLFLVIAVRIKLEDGGPVIYSQTRLGKNEKPFKMYKFRSMVQNADQIKQQLLDQNEVEGAMFKMKEDPRVTKTGKWIRKYSLDELPQLVNVLLGDMSLVGPRPPLPSEVAEYTDYDKQRLLVTPGCTGLWQATIRNDSNFDEMVYLDIRYINKMNIWIDFYIILKTVWIMIKPNSAF